MLFFGTNSSVKALKEYAAESSALFFEQAVDPFQMLTHYLG